MKQQVVTIGLGYIGLPTSALIASNSIYVHGVDINENVVNTINEGKIHIVEPSLEGAVSKSVSTGFLKAGLTPIEADVFLIVVPTPFKDRNEPDISFVESATKAVIPFLKKGDLFIIESTSPIGTTEEMASLIFNSRPDLKNSIFIAYCPERVLPGNVMHELVYNDRVIGGLNHESSLKAASFYRQFVLGDLHITNSRTAEMCKLVENSSRDVQIAFANELSIICEKANINVWELISLANKHPRVNILQPGCGVGGHCIAVDPYFIVADYPMESKLIGTAREVNNYKSFWCSEQVNKSIVKFQLEFNRKPTIAIMGLAFKPDIDDLRESPAKYIAQRVMQDSQDEYFYIVEPNIDNHPIYKLTNYNYAIDKADILVFLVAHKEFKNLSISSNKIVLDFCGVVSRN
jgi:UDP-N-acetyl-D-mannosaminuronic acid dehydrogenase